MISDVNQIAVRQRTSATDAKREIEEALRRDAEEEAARASVSVSDGTVPLSGEADRFHDMDVIEDPA